MQEKYKELRPEEIDRVVEMAWEDRTPFEAIQAQFSLSEQQVIKIMRTEMLSSSFRMWRKRVQGRITKHMKLTENLDTRFKSNMQRQISMNRISKRV
ncbi:TIGR03643 family protein [Dyadobacter fanqingshengii]|uniref:TIGR03643 family protein n=1 Tax=Dyadobacter fanqingshengii TaxID=2906443 RepID=A0A9X1TGH3_9BACT|nr:TIGR03643 family protein [Dyadobacter fanqingshengii]MCF0040432.1 TIGR03643 family protein [Dyadobacter fanqingshengii]USJ37826.1 TIGR03643 family protein [Dyadobacter fanqingshengii]